MKKIAQVIVGLVVAACAAAAWHFWHIDGLWAFLIVLGGIGVAYQAFGCE